MQKEKKVMAHLPKRNIERKNRSGNHVSINLFKAYDRLVNEYGLKINPIIRKNLEAMTEIRDNSVHFFNKDFNFKKKVHEIGSTNLKNYLNLVRQWFGVSLNEYNIFLIDVYT